LLSRYNFEFVDEEDNVVAVTPGEGPNVDMPQAKVVAGEEDGGGDVNLEMENGGD
jgi:cleavage and polyadenylation specificity factor subunit 5